MNEAVKRVTGKRTRCIFLFMAITEVSVFEGFFDFLSYQSICQIQDEQVVNLLVLNSLSFFEKSVLLMEKHDNIQLYLDNDHAGKK